MQLHFIARCNNLSAREATYFKLTFSQLMHIEHYGVWEIEDKESEMLRLKQREPE